MWNSMETAPFDGNYLICYEYTDVGGKKICKRNIRTKNDVGGYEGVRRAIGWMPLPEPPSVKGTDRNE